MKNKKPTARQTRSGHKEPQKEPHENRTHCSTKAKACQTKKELTRTMEEQPHYWAILPAPVRYNMQLPPMARLLYAEISALANHVGYCFASNQYFMRLYKISDRTLQAHLKALKAGGYIRIEDGDGGAKPRRIYAGINPLAETPEENFGGMTHPEENFGGAPKKSSGVTIEQKEIIIPPKAPQGGKRASGGSSAGLTAGGKEAPGGERASGGKEAKGASVPEWKPERFAKFWDFYPRLPDGRKPNKARAAKAWDKLRPDDSTIDAMATALMRQVRSDQWSRGIGIPYASTWLNGRGWEDDYQPPEAAAPDGEDIVWLSLE